MRPYTGLDPGAPGRLPLTSAAGTPRKADQDTGSTAWPVPGSNSPELTQFSCAWVGGSAGGMMEAQEVAAPQLRALPAGRLLPVHIPTHLAPPLAASP